jgi:class 3 adenylate cyclase
MHSSAYFVVISGAKSMAEGPTQRIRLYQSISFKNIVLFLLILLVALVPLSLRYYQDSRDYEIEILASKLEFFAERGASWLDTVAIDQLRQPAQMQSPAYRHLQRTLNKIENEFGVDNAIVMRREPTGQYAYIASGNGGASLIDMARNPCDTSASPVSPVRRNKPSAVKNPCHAEAVQHPGAVKNPCSAAAGASGFALGQPVDIHRLFPDAYKATDDTWQQGEMMHSQLFGGRVAGREFDQFLQINTPLKIDGRVAAILMLNKFANPVADAVRAKTLAVFGMTLGILLVELTLFGYISARMLRPLRHLTAVAGKVAQGHLDLSLPPTRRHDEVGQLTRTFDTMLDGLRQRDFIRDTFGRYVSPEVAEAVINSPQGPALGGEIREVTFLVSDLRGFTSMSSRLPPHEVIDILNRYLERMVDTILQYRGTIDEFQGDGILAFFGAPLAAEDDQERAVACAIAMQNALLEINAEQRQRGLPTLNMGIGINTGEAIVGNIGSEKRTKYGAVGSAINEAYRIESYTIGGQILISPSTYEEVRELADVQSTQEVQFKGLEHPITLHNIAGIRGQYAISLPVKTPEIIVPLATPLPIQCFSIDGKTVSEQAIAGQITHLADTSAEVVMASPVALHSNLMLRLLPADEPEISEIYAKVIPHLELQGEPASQDGQPRIRLGLTSVPDTAQRLLDRQRAAVS